MSDAGVSDASVSDAGVSDAGVSDARASLPDAVGPQDAIGDPAEVQRGGWAGLAEVAVLLGLALVAWVLSGGFAEGELLVTYGVDPAVVPRAVILVIVALAILLAIGEPWPRGTPPRLHIHPRLREALFALVALSIYVLSFEALGAFTLMPLFCAAVSRTFMNRPLWALLAYGVAVSAFTWILFVLLLRVPLPGSRLPFL